MSHPFLFICPICGTEESIEHHRCRMCGTEFHWEQGKFRLPAESLSAHQMLQRMSETIPLQQTSRHIPESFRKRLPHGLEPWRISQPAVLRQARNNITFRGFQGLFSRNIEVPLPVDRGHLVFYPEEVVFVGEKRVHRFPLTDFTCVTTNSHYFEFKLKKRPFYQIEFRRESALKYEILFRKWLDRFYREQGKRILEYQPMLRVVAPECPATRAVLYPTGTPVPGKVEKWVVKTILALIRWFGRRWLGMRTQGNQQLPEEYPFILLANHQSIVDPFLILALLDSRIAFLTKSTSFISPLARYFLRIGRGIPTTRYQTDPLVYPYVRQALERNIPVGIFPEGERCWDGARQPIKMNVVRLLCYFAVPIVVVSLCNVYSAWPRWQTLPTRGNGRMVVGYPFCLNQRANFSLQDFRQFLETQLDRCQMPGEEQS